MNSERFHPSPERELFDPRALSIATATFYPKWYEGEMKYESVDKVRGDLALASAKRVAEHGYQMSVVDGGSSEAFRSALSSYVATVSPEEQRGMSASRRQAFTEASEKSGAKVIIWTEPEKVSFIDSLGVATAPIRAGTADIVVPKRNELLFQGTYPDYQYDSEIEGNKVYNDILRSRGLLTADERDLDMYFGPKIFANTDEVTAVFHNAYTYTGTKDYGVRKYIDPEKYSDAIFFPIPAALHAGLRVASIDVPFRYPATQLAIEQTNDDVLKQSFVDKRKSQRNGISAELIQFIRYLDANPHKPSHLQPK